STRSPTQALLPPRPARTRSSRGRGFSNNANDLPRPTAADRSRESTRPVSGSCPVLAFRLEAGETPLLESAALHQVLERESSLRAPLAPRTYPRDAPRCIARSPRKSRACG